MCQPQLSIQYSLQVHAIERPSHGAIGRPGHLQGMRYETDVGDDVNETLIGWKYDVLKQNDSFSS